MTEIKAKLNYYRVSPRKVRLVADLIRGKRVDEALRQLKFVKKKPAEALAKLLQSALSNAKHNYKIDIEEDNLYIKEIRVDEGPSYKRWRPVWRGMAHPFKRRTSHISLTLSQKQENAKN